MFDFLNHADSYQKTFWYIAIPVTLFFVIQMVLTFSGLAGDTDVDTDIEVGEMDGFMEYFTIRNAINFLLGFSWTGIIMQNTIENKLLLIAAAVTVGMIFVVLYFYLAQQIKKFEEDNTFDPEEIVGHEGEVYLRIPGDHLGEGKVLVSHKGTVHELFAVTDEKEIPTGNKVIIEAITEDNKLIVRSIQ